MPGDYTIGDRLRRELRMADDQEEWREAMIRQYSEDLWDRSISNLAASKNWNNCKPADIRKAKELMREELLFVAARLYADLHTVGPTDLYLSLLFELAIMDLASIGNRHLDDCIGKQKQRKSQITPGEQPQPDLTELLAALEDALR